MPEINQNSVRQLIGLLVIVAMVATLARLVYYAVHWSDLVGAANLSWPKWGVVALFCVWFCWSSRRKTKLD